MNLNEENTFFNTSEKVSAEAEVLVNRLVQEIENNAVEIKRYTLEIENNTVEIKRLNQELITKEAHIQRLSLELDRLKRLKFAQKSEVFKASEQIELFDETLSADIEAIEAELEQLGVKPPREPKKSHKGRNPLPKELPRVEIRHEPESCTCGSCGMDLVKIGEDITEQLDVEPAQFFVQRHIRPQYACHHCQTMDAAPVPAAIIDGGMATPGILTWILISKYVDHSPLYRLQQIAARSGVTLARSTLSEWVGRTGVALSPLVDRLQELLLERSVLHADETPVAQLDPGRGKTKRAYLWAYCSSVWDTGPPILIFDYQGGRSGVYARQFLKDWKGHLMVDDYGGYKALFHNGVIELGCLTHARRKFFDLHTSNPTPLSTQAMMWFGKLYDIEREAADFSVEERGILRQEKAQPVLKSFREWLIFKRRTVADGSGMARAMDYSLKRWEALARYAMAGHLPIDNNRIENGIRPIAIGKKNWLYAGSELAGQRAAAIQSLLATAKLNGLDPYAWLKDTLEKLPTWPNSRLDELLPFANPKK